MAFDLARFVTAQDDNGVYQRALDELRAGRKQTHWMWFVFPQIAGLGHSGTARHFAVSGLGEVVAYLADPVLGPRLRECASALTSLPGSDAVAVLGPIDAMKLRSSMTLFAEGAPDDTVFREVLEKYFHGVPDQKTLDLLRG
jgi:uncharacterized protein (DUF1810 family)